MKLGIINLGCPKNTVDMECMLSVLGNPALTTDPREADVIIINTCAFLKSARGESEKAIKDMLKFKKTKPDLKIIVAGCFVSKDAGILADKFKEVHSFVGINDIYSIKKAVEKSGMYCGADSFVHKSGDHNVILNPYSVYLKVSEGCNHKCSFCLIPSIKGRYRSRSVPDIVSEAKKMAEAGVKEINLISQDLSYYGNDLRGNKNITGLVRSILKGVDKKIWIRLLYLYPEKNVLKELAEIMNGDSRLVKYMDIPFQHISDTVLTSMKRGYRKKDILDIIQMLR
ncbi:MAG TPA: radical SAM protein, partial [Firmicutes bacterium]|nr:radical SAM protein [Bacillota bacterium]